MIRLFLVRTLSPLVQGHRALRTFAWGPALALAVAWPLATANAQSAIDQLEQFVETVQSASGSFEQRQEDDAGQETGQAQHGVFRFERPGKFRWETTQPHEQLILSDGRQLWQYDPDLAQVIERDVDESIGASPAAILFGSDDLTDAFDLSERPDAEGLQWLRAKPLAADAGFAHVDIGFDQAMPRQIILHDAFSQTTRIGLADLQTNTDLDPDTFRLDVPDDVDWVKM
ncbi:MAG TPA: outer membrane lipoprotein chaperone LolA [Burkholderiaceae bacterium]|nr:outer membrane lipoprotein chaperone LolA [Burkholderiaceae bacterium]